MEEPLHKNLQLIIKMSILSKIVLSVAAIFAATDISFAQSYSIVPNDTINMIGMMEDLETLSIQQLNTSTNILQLKWAKLSESVPAMWEASVCDNQVCYTSLVDSGSMNPINPNDYGLLLTHITPHVNYGTAVIRYVVWDITNPAIKDTLTYILTVTTTSGSPDGENKNAFSIFPNPASENINIISNLPAGFQFLIIDIYGRKIENGCSKTNLISIDTKNFRNGIYSMSILTEHNIITTKQFLIQK